MATLSSSPL
jgi:hypothetical protein